MHRLICPVRSHWLHRRNFQPFWRDDKVAQLLGIAWYGCPRCGWRATAEWAKERGRWGTCPTVCVERNHPGHEHKQWVEEILRP